MRIEKRIPFGFVGEWGKVYKLYNFDEKNQNVIEWQKSNYRDIGQDVQFRCHTDKSVSISQTVKNLVSKGEYRAVETTDSYFDEETKQYNCVVDIGDIVLFGGEYYVCDKIDAKEIFTPREQTFYICGLKKIYDKILRS